MHLKQFKRLIPSLALVVTAAASAATDYPSSPITLIIPVAAGGTTDIAGRALAEGLKPVLGETVIVENRPGASGSIANSFVSRSKPDGYTLLLSYEGYHTGNPALFKNMDWDPIKSFTPIAEVIRGPHLILVPEKSPAKTLQDLIALAKESPGKLNYASAGIGSIQHLGAEQLQILTDTQMTHVPYTGAAPAMQDLIAGRIDFFITTPPTAISHLQANRVRALAITSAKRHPMLPDIPSITEAGLPEFELEAGFSVFGPADMPQDVVQKLSTAMEKVITSDKFSEQMGKMGSNASYKSPEQVSKIVKDDLKKWATVVDTAGIEKP